MQLSFSVHQMISVLNSQFKLIIVLSVLFYYHYIKPCTCVCACARIGTCTCMCNLIPINLSVVEKANSDASLSFGQ
jgi:hypothetical protein